MRNKLLCFLIIFHSICFSQNDIEWVQELIQNYIDQNPEGVYDVMELESQIFHLIENPVLISKKHIGNIESLFFLSPISRKNLEEHLINSGDLLSIYELQSIPTISLDLARILAVLIRLPSDEFSLTEKKFYGFLKFGLRQNFHNGMAYFNGNYLGSSHRSFLRTQLNLSKKLRFGFNFDKDPGESYFHKSYVYGLPHLSAFLSFQGKRIQHLILGDYKVMLGQGLLVYQGYGFGKTMDIPSSVKGFSGIRPNTSLSENFFFRGTAGHFRFQRWDLIGFFGLKKIAASLQDDLSFSSIDQSGFVRTTNEIQRNNQVQAYQIGARVAYRLKKGHIGMQFLSDQFSHFYAPKPNLYQVHLASRKSFYKSSLDYQLYIKNNLFYGENAVQFENFGLALLNGIMTVLNEKTSLNFSFRYYSASFLSFHASTLSESSNHRNEWGVLFQLNHQWNKKFKFFLLLDYFQFPWLTYNLDRPSSGFELNSRLLYKWSKKQIAYLSLRVKAKDVEMEQEILKAYKFQCRLNFQKELDRKLKFKTRLEFNIRHALKSNFGSLFYTELQFAPNLKWTFIYRINLFATDSFENAIYSLERSIPTINQFQMYNGEGLASYLFVKWKPLKKMQFKIKLDGIYYFNQSNIGSGNDLILSNSNGGISLEFEWKF